jgi:hypothetical protein
MIVLTVKRKRKAMFGLRTLLDEFEIAKPILEGYDFPYTGFLILPERRQF